MSSLLNRFSELTTLTTPLSTADITSAPLNIVELWKQLLDVPDISAASYVPDRTTSNGYRSIAVQSSQRDPQLDEKRSILQYYTLDPLQHSRSFIPTPATEQRDVVYWNVSPSGQKLLVIRKNTKHASASKDSSNDKPPVFWFDVYDNVTHRLLHTKSTKDSDHGKILTSGTLGGIQWNDNEDAIVYIAEPQSVIQKQAATFVDDDPKSDSKTRGLTFESVEEWGEAYIGVASPRPYVLSLHYPVSIYPIDGIPYNVTASQCRWAPPLVDSPPPSSDATATPQSSTASLDSGLLLTIFPHNQRKLGVTHYNTRESGIFYAPFSLTAKIEESRRDLLTRRNNAANANKVNDNGDGNNNNAKSKAEQSNSAKQPPTIDESSLVLLTPSDVSAMTARVSPDKRKMLYVTAPTKTHAHFVASSLRVLDWSIASEAIQSRQRSVPQNSSKTVIAPIDQPHSIESFPSLYLAAGLLPNNVWLTDSVRIVLSTSWRSVNALVVINTQKGNVVRIQPPSNVPTQSSMALQDICGDNVLVTVSNLNTPPSLYTALITGGSSITVDWLQVHQPLYPLNSSVTQSISAIHWSIDQIEPSTLPELPFETIIIMPPKRGGNGGLNTNAAADDGLAASSDKLPPCIVYPHGGPHSVYSTAWSPGVAYFALSGFAVLLINYRGSTGFGEQFLQTLPGRCGALDVLDCMDAIAYVTGGGRAGGQSHNTRPRLVDKDRLSVFGGSHGGFLTLHLVGQYPDTFKAACVRNPVANVNAMSGLSDIPDWCWFESGLEYRVEAPPDTKQQQAMYSASPMAHVTKVKTPVFMMLGGNDKRCPIQQAIDYARYLKANGVKHRIAIYKEGQHSLDDTVAMLYDQLPNALLWLSQRFYTVDDAREKKTVDLSIPYATLD